MSFRKCHQFDKPNFYLFRLYVSEKSLSTSAKVRSVLTNIYLYIYIHIEFSSIFETVHNIAEDAASLNSNKIPSACYRNELLLFYVIAVWEQKPSPHFRFPRISYFFYRYPPSLRYITSSPLFLYPKLPPRALCHKITDLTKRHA